MSIESQLKQLALDGWSFWLEGNRLRYRAPRNQADPEVLESLRERKTEIMTFLRSQTHALEVCPLSQGQRALWFLWRLAPESVAYHQSLPLHVPAGTDTEGWQRICEIIVTRHSQLRTTFSEFEGNPIQQTGSGLPLDFERIDASGWSHDAIHAAIAEMHRIPFDLKAGPLVRFRWFDCGADSDILLVTMHHIVCDGWSLEILRRELTALQKQLSSNESTLLPDIKHIYHDYVRWQQRILTGPESEKLWAFWQTELATPLPVLELPYDAPRPSIQTYHGSSHRFVLPSDATSALQTFARSEQTTNFVVLLSAFLVLLHRYAGQDDIVIGIPTAGRTRTEFSGIVGYFVDPVPLRSRLTADATSHTYVQEIRDHFLAAMAHRDLPFASLIEKLKPRRDPSRSPLFDVTFNHVQIETAAVAQKTGADSENAGTTVFDIEQADGKFDLTLNVLEVGGHMRVSFGYNTDLFSEESIVLMSKHYRCLLDTLMCNPSAEVRSIRMHQDESLKSVVCGEPLTSDDRFSVPEQFALQASRVPTRVAVRAGETSLTYEQLAARVDAVANQLYASGVRSNVPVGVCTGRSVDLVVAILSVLKSGGAYVPLDPSYPQAMLEDMMSQAGVEHVIIGSSTPTLSWAEGTTILDLEEVSDSMPISSLAPPKPDDLVYILFTSGTTGRPKGVSVEHRSLSNYVSEITGVLGVTENEEFGYISAISADLGNTMLFPALCTGGCLHILPEDVMVNPQTYDQYLRKQPLDYLKIVPSHLAALTDSLGACPPLPTKGLVLGGEATPVKWVRRWQDARPNCRIFNHYGPAEATVGVMTYRFDADTAPIAGNMPLRNVLGGCEVTILDEGGTPVPAGVPGELHIGGICLARGYINDSEKTSEAFALHDDRILYATGDRARWLPNGDLDILGRVDRQVKIRGYRVELAHVETVLHRQEGVRQGVVLAADRGGEEPRLVAYVTLDEATYAEQHTTSDFGTALRSTLGEILPNYMVPETVVVLEQMPLSANGKIDYSALAHFSENTEDTSDESDAPQDAYERKLERIWATILDRTKVSRNDNFFDIGGHSLLAVRLVGRIFQEFGISLSLAALLTHPTIAELARELRSSCGDLPSVVVRLSAHSDAHRDSKEALFLLPGAGGNIMYLQNLAHLLDLAYPIYGLQALGLTPGEKICKTIPAAASRYIAAIQKIQSTGPYRIAGHSYGGLVAFEMAHQLQAQGETVAFVGVIDNAAPDPSQRDIHKGWNDEQWLRHVALRIGKLYGRDMELDRLFANATTRDERVSGLADRLVDTGLLPRDTPRRYLWRFIEVYQSNAQSAMRYEPSMLPEGVGLTVFRASEEDASLLGQAGMTERDLGWTHHAVETVEVVDVPGTHLTMMIEPYVADLANALIQKIKKKS